MSNLVVITAALLLVAAPGAWGTEPGPSGTDAPVVLDSTEAAAFSALIAVSLTSVELEEARGATLPEDDGAPP